MELVFVAIVAVGIIAGRITEGILNAGASTEEE
jgi:hypothetical protein